MNLTLQQRYQYKIHSLTRVDLTIQSWDNFKSNVVILTLWHQRHYNVAYWFSNVPTLPKLCPNVECLLELPFRRFFSQFFLVKVFACVALRVWVLSWRNNSVKRNVSTIFHKICDINFKLNKLIYALRLLLSFYKKPV